MKRLLSIMTMLLWTVVALAQVFEVDGIKYNITSSEDLTVEVRSNGYSGDVVIPTSVLYDENTYSVMSIGDFAFSHCGGLTSVTIPSSVTNIEDNAFNGCRDLTSVHITDIASWLSINFANRESNPLSFAHHLFVNEEEVTDLVIPDGVTAIGKYCFAGCSGLTSVTIPNSVTSIGGSAFYDCMGLRSVHITDIASWLSISFANYDSNPLYYARHLYVNEESITDLVIPDGVTAIAKYCFANCSCLTSVTIPNSVTSIGASAFSGCSSLTSITIPNSVTSIEDNAFYCCRDLTSVHITDIASWLSINFANRESNPLSEAHHLFVNEEEVTDLVIPDGVTAIGENWFAGCSGLTSVTIPNSVTSIGDNVFHGCSGLTSVTIPNSVTSIGDNVFHGCSGLTSVTIPNSVASIGDNVFDGCSGLTSVTIPNSVTSIGDNVFYGCSGLTSITIPSSVTSIDASTFKGCTSLTSIVVEDGNPVYDSRDNCNAIINTTNNELIYGCKNSTIPNSVTSIGDSAFYNCSGLISISIPNSVTSIGHYAFFGCIGLTSITIPNSVTSIGGGAFQECSNLTSFTIPGSVISIGANSFSHTAWENALHLPDWEPIYYENILLGGSSGVTGNVNIKEGTRLIAGAAFFHCPNLTSVSIPNSVTSIGTLAFGFCSELKEVVSMIEEPFAIDPLCWLLNNTDNITLYVPVGTKELYEATEGWNMIKNIEEITNRVSNTVFEVDGITYNVTSTENKTVEVAESSKWYTGDIVIPDIVEFNGDDYSVKGISVRGFSSCKDLTSVTIPNSVESIGEKSFQSCIGIISITIPNSVTSIGESAFWGCAGLTSITIPNSVTSISNGAFSNCSGLTTVTISDGVMSIGESAFSGCSGLTSITIPNSVTSIGESAFQNCSGLTSVTVSDGVTSIGKWSFCNCSSLSSISIPNSVTSIGQRAFWGCSGLTSITIPNSVTSIGDYAFSQCLGLTTISIPNSVTSIGADAFSFCSGLTEVISMIESPFSISEYSWYEVDTDNIPLYVPKGTKALYEATEGWNVFKTIIDADDIENTVYLDDIVAIHGTQLKMPLKMKNTAGIRGFQFDMYLPEGVTVAKTEGGQLKASLSSGRRAEGDQHTLTVSEMEDGAFRFLCGSMYDETFTGNDGEVATVTLDVDIDMAEGDYTIALKNIKLTETNINNYYETAELKGLLTVNPYKIGDISGDGEIDVSDYIGVANYILGNTPEGFNVLAADVNGDNVVDVSDYIGVANLILYGDVYGNSNTAASRGYKSLRKANTDVSGMDNVIYISPFQAAQGSQMAISIKMKNTAEIRGFQFDLYLPEGMSVVKDGINRIQGFLTNARKPVGDQHTLTLSEQPDGAIRFLCASQYDETFTGTDGEIATLLVDVSSGMELDDYPVLLKKMKLSETDINNYYETELLETTVTVTEALDTRTLLSEESTTPVSASDGAVDVRVQRTIKAGEWSTICLPFAMTEAQVTTAFGDDVALGDFTGYDVTKENNVIVGITINFDAATAIEANHPYVIKVTDDVDEFTVDGVTIAPADNPRVEYDNGKTGKQREVFGTFVGTYVADYDFYNEAKKYPLFLSKNKFYYATENTKHMKAFRAFFDFEDFLPEAEGGASARVTMSFGDETTDVKELKSSRVEELKSYYNLKGQRVEAPVKKGLYIHDGKKVVIK